MPWLLLLAATVACALVVCLFFTSVPAFAGKIYYPEISFGAPGSAPGQFDEPVGVAVNDATGIEAGDGDVYVVDKGNDRVERFGAVGVYLGQFDGSGEYEVEGKIEHGTAAPTGTFASPEVIAVDNCTNRLGERCTTLEDPSVGDVYVDARGNEYEEGSDRVSDKVIDKFGPTGAYEGQITQATCPEPNKHKPPVEQKTEGEFCVPGSSVPFNKITGIAVADNGYLWLSYELHFKTATGEWSHQYVAELNNDGTLIKALSCESGGRLATDSSGNLYLSNTVAVEKVNGEKLEEEWNDRFAEEGVRPTALAIAPATNNLIVDKGGSMGLYGPFGEPYTVTAGTRVKLTPVEEFPGETVPTGYPGFSESHGVAVNASGTVYASERSADRIESFSYVPVPGVETESPTVVGEEELGLSGRVNPEGEALEECFFEYGTVPGVYSKKAPCAQRPESISGNTWVSVSVGLRHLGAADVRSFRLVVVSGSGVRVPGNGLTIAIPVVSEETASGVGSSTATVSAGLDPGSLSTCYRFEYGTGGEYGKSWPEPPAPEACVGPSAEPVGVSAELTGLQPATEYDIRVTAKNAFGTKISQAVSFTTFAPTSAKLPDGRAYELVSPVGAGDGTEVYVPDGLEEHLDSSGVHGVYTARPFAAAASGEAVTYVGDPPPKGGNGAVGDGGGSEYLARRSTGGGWTPVDLSSSTTIDEYLDFSRDLSVGVLRTTAQLGGGVPEGFGGLYSHGTAGEAFAPLIPVGPENRSPEELGAVLNGAFGKEVIFTGGNAGTGNVPALSHLLFEASAALPSSPGAPGGGVLENNLYDDVGGRLYLVNVLPTGHPQVNVTFGRQGPSTNGHESPETDHVVSADGSRIFWSSVKVAPVGSEYEEQPTALYVRENDTQPEECAVAVDACTVEVASGDAEFQTASSDGSLVFYTKEGSLYSFDIETGQTTDLSVPINPPEKAEVQGVMGASEDGSYVYFVADGVLSAGKNVEEREPETGQPNLYVYHEGEITFIATLWAGDGNPQDGSDGDVNHDEAGKVGDWQADLGHRTAAITPDGQSVVFMSRNPLTGYDNKVESESNGVRTITPLTEVFVYDAQTQRLACASCNPSGERPTADLYSEFADQIDGVWGSFLPVSDSLTGYQPRVISQDGRRVFFDSVEPLTPQDDNGWLDVYEWEAPGEGSCTLQAESMVTGGCVYLLSGGQSPENSYLVDASANGNDVFFVSRAALVKADRGVYDELYDARVGGVEPPEEKRCSGAGCQGVPPAPPIFATPASVTFEGTGDFTSGETSATGKAQPKLTRAQELARALRACERKRAARKRLACETVARQRYGAKRGVKKAARRAGRGRGGRR